MPRITTPLSPSRLRLRVLRVLMAEPDRYNLITLAEHLGERYDRVRDAVEDIAAEFGITRSGAQLLRVVLPGEAVIS